MELGFCLMVSLDGKEQTAQEILAVLVLDDPPSETDDVVSLESILVLLVRQNHLLDKLFGRFGQFPLLDDSDNQLPDDLQNHLEGFQSLGL